MDNLSKVLKKAHMKRFSFITQFKIYYCLPVVEKYLADLTIFKILLI